MKYVFSNISEVSYSMLETFTTTLEGNWMANRKLNYDKIYELIMECRNGGLSDHQWCIDHDINPSTFYYWIRKLRQMACYDIPDISRMMKKLFVFQCQNRTWCVYQMEGEKEHGTYCKRPADYGIKRYAAQLAENESDTTDCFR